MAAALSSKRALREAREQHDSGNVERTDRVENAARLDFCLLLGPVCAGEVCVARTSLENDVGGEDRFEGGALGRSLVADGEVAFTADLLLLCSH